MWYFRHCSIHFFQPNTACLLFWSYSLCLQLCCDVCNAAIYCTMHLCNTFCIVATQSARNCTKLSVFQLTARYNVMLSVSQILSAHAMLYCCLCCNCLFDMQLCDGVCIAAVYYTCNWVMLPELQLFILRAIAYQCLQYTVNPAKRKRLR